MRLYATPQRACVGIDHGTRIAADKCSPRGVASHRALPLRPGGLRFKYVCRALRRPWPTIARRREGRPRRNCRQDDWSPACGVWLLLRRPQRSRRTSANALHSRTSRLPRTPTQNIARAHANSVVKRPCPVSRLGSDFQRYRDSARPAGAFNGEGGSSHAGTGDHRERSAAR